MGKYKALHGGRGLWELVPKSSVDTTKFTIPSGLSSTTCDADSPVTRTHRFGGTMHLADRVAVGCSCYLLACMTVHAHVGIDRSG